MRALSGEKILVTGAAGQIGFPMARFLASENEVWGAARFRAEGSQARVTATGVTPIRLDLAAGDYGDLPDDFTYVVHLAAYIGPNPDIDRAMRNNAEPVGFLMHHCRKAKAVLVMSTHSVYRPHPDPAHAYGEGDPLGETNAAFAPTYAMSKIGEEAVARTCARLFDVPVTIARMNASYGPGGGLPAYDADAVVAGRPVVTRHDPSWYSPIFEDDINEQVAAMLAAASVPATIVNWGGDEVVSVQEWCSYIAELSGRPAAVEILPSDGGPAGAVADVSRRTAITGPCRVDWRDGMLATLRARHPELTAPA
ncbi:MAG: NAD(P)-dependent oxidoreductase [Acidimicrobiales bacterium]|jgi:nucleoside-diphosphate-sugar epimerase